MNQANGGNILFKFLGDDKDLTGKMSGLKNGLGKLGGAVSVLGATAMATTAAATGAVVTLTKKSVEAYAELEQSLGGVETLFKDNADTVIKNAKEAYKTAGVDANTYMQEVTSFAASLLQSVGNDTAKAADIADMAFRDMSDNANKFGTDMSSIQNAYQGFAKQNYTMLDNLKLGYGGTKEEMARLLADAEKLTGVHYDISNLSDVYNAIHAIQEKLGVTGTTANEASSTIQGSVTSAKAAIQNFLSGAGGIDEVVSTVTTAGIQIGKAITKMLPQIVQGIVGLINGLMPELPGLIQTLLPVLMDGVVMLVEGLLNVLPDLLTTLISMINPILTALIDVFVKITKALGEQMPTLVPMIVDALVEALISLLENVDVVIEACMALIIGLTEGIFRALPQLIARLPEIIKAIIKGLINASSSLNTAGIDLCRTLTKGILSLPGELMSAGANMIKGIWNGIKNYDIVGKIKDLARNMLKGMKSVLGIHSPSTAFAYLGKQSVLGYTNQLEDMKGMLNGVIESTFSLSPQLTNGGLHYSPNVIVNNNIETNVDPLGQMVSKVKTFANGAKNDYNYGMGV